MRVQDRFLHARPLEAAMSKRVTRVIGKPVVSALTGERLGTVADLLLDDTGTAVVGFVLRDGWLKGETVLPASALQTLGRDAIVSRSSELIGAKEWREQHDAIEQHPKDGAHEPPSFGTAG
jgi:uncharacterized protein YrrD